LRMVARRFIGEVFDLLEREHVIPLPHFAPHVRVGRDYFGDTIRSAASYSELETAIEDLAPERFAGTAVQLAARDFPSNYVFPLIDAAIYLCTVDGGGYASTSTAVTEAIATLVTALTDASPEVAVCRAVTHLTTTSGEPIVLGSIGVTPAVGLDALRHIGSEIPSAGSALTRDPPFVYDPPGSVLTIRGASGSDPYQTTEELSLQLERFLVAVRLVTSASVQSAIEIRGATVRINRMVPHRFDFQISGSLGSLIRRTARLSVGDAGLIARVTELLGTRAVRREGVLISSFNMALSAYNRSHQAAPWTDRLVDLATALEAAGPLLHHVMGLIHNSSVVLRLRHRAGTLLVTENDPSAAINGDLKLLYELRSTLVHGGDLTEKRLKRMLAGLSRVPSDSSPGVRAELAVDRLRDLVRRSILARLSLGGGEDPLWPFDEPLDVDALLVDDTKRVEWRSAWQMHIGQLAGNSAVRRARMAVDSISRDD
jgi:hypothetical protein